MKIARQQLVGAENSSVIFVRDYVQLVFERDGQTRDARLSIYGRSTVVEARARSNSADAEYPSRLVRAIDRVVEDVKARTRPSCFACAAT